MSAVGKGMGLEGGLRHEGLCIRPGDGHGVSKWQPAQWGDFPHFSENDVLRHLLLGGKPVSGASRRN